MTVLTPTSASASIWCMSIGLFANGTNGFGIVRINKVEFRVLRVFKIKIINRDILFFKKQINVKNQIFVDMNHFQGFLLQF